MEEALKNLLIAKEQRVEKQNLLLDEYQIPLVAIHANCPGKEKTTVYTKLLVKEMSEIFQSRWHLAVRYGEYFESAEGPVAIFMVDEGAEKLKGMTMKTEEQHTLGRFCDIDVYTIEKLQISRRDIGYCARKCYICENDAKICARNSSHPLWELTIYMNDCIDAYFKAKGGKYESYNANIRGTDKIAQGQ